ncbi:glycoside hydrolase [Acephala macrosclerotiorum]|nr:glycoside hydrolase [Acephala macrosclerotiorum]
MSRPRHRSTSVFIPTSSKASTTGTATSYNCAVSNPPPSSAGTVKIAGVNLSGFDWGCSTDLNSPFPFSSSPDTDFATGNVRRQMTHFVNDDGFNVFRLPVAWQWIINNATAASGVLHEGNIELFVQACLAAGASCIIGQGGPSNATFAQLWGNLAAKYASQPKVIFEIMNEPWSVNITLWAQTVQAAVTTIRTAGASNMILFLGTDWAAVWAFTGGSAAAILVFDVYQYLDSGSGTSSTFIIDAISWGFAPLTEWLRCNGRQAFLTGAGGGSMASCVQYMCNVIPFLNANSDVYVGYTRWAAGGMLQPYVLSEASNMLPDGTWVDHLLVSSCMAPKKHWD